MDTGTRGFPGGDIRVSDAERDQAIAELSEHFQSGRLTQDEFDDRSGRALKARTGTDLGGLFGDLPPRHAVTTPPQSAFAATDTEFTPGDPPRPNFLPVGRVIIAFVVAAIIAGGLFGVHGHHHGGSIGWLVPVVVVCLVVLRLRGRR
jgi:DUF1707 SHOCT-like domain